MPNKNQGIKQSNNPFPAMEEEVLNFWDKNKIFEKSVNRQALCGDYIFYDGPPFATGEPHYGHIVASIMKDAAPRYWTMRGYRVERRWGWDCHGLPVENLAEKELGFKNKQDIEKIGVAKFNDYCKSIVLRYAEEWKKTIRRIGRWVDMEHDYKTMDPDYMETIWWVFKTLWDKKLIYQGYKAMHICPRCGTTLSNFEVTQNYKEIKDLSATVKFKLEPGQKIGDFVTDDNTYILAWTTTPWTLIGNVALVVGEKIEYVILETTQRREGTVSIGGQTTSWDVKPGEKLIFAKDYFGKLDAHYLYGKGPDVAEVNSDMLRYYIAQDEVLEKYRVKKIQGLNFIGLKYKPLFDYYSKDETLENRENGWKIYAGDFVTTDEGAGVVHIAPAFGEDDMKLGQEKNLPFIQHINMDGLIEAEAKDFAGMNVKPADDTQKTDVEIIKYLAHKGLLFHKEKYEHSYPHCWRCETPLLNYAADSWFVKVTAVKDKLIKNNQKIKWVPEHIKDGRFGKWLDQARDWAISRNRYWGATLPVWICDKCEAKTVVGSRAELKKLSGKMADDLHKQYVDEISWGCKKCDGIMKRIPEVFDCWFESGSMPYGQEHYPFTEKKFKDNFPVPADFIAEGIDQTRGWFYTMMVLSTALFGVGAAKNIIANGIVLSEDGQKMSKRLKNYPDPSYIFKQYGVDAMRYYLFASPVLVAENLNFSETGVRDSLRKIIMILWNVYKFYAMYEKEGANKNGECLLPECENVLDKWILARLNILIKEVTQGMDGYNIPKAVRPIDGFINDFSTWYIRRSRDRFKSENEADKKLAIGVTKYVLVQLAKVMAPFTPFIAETIWQKVTGLNFKDENKSVHLEKWPKAGKIDDKIIGDMVIVRKIVELGLVERDKAGIKVRQILSTYEISDFGLSKEYLRLIKDELNVKIVSISPSPSPSSSPSPSPSLSPSPSSSDIDLNTNMTPELEFEGLKREIVRSVNNLRKNARLTIKDKIILSWQSDSALVKKVFAEMGEELKKDTLSEKIIESEVEGEEIKVNGEIVKLGVKKI
ncbi:MAG: isoleucine--tRNA ligase [Candidatus Falkowbacteria bacterium]